MSARPQPAFETLQGLGGMVQEFRVRVLAASGELATQVAALEAAQLEWVRNAKAQLAFLVEQAEKETLEERKRVLRFLRDPPKELRAKLEKESSDWLEVSKLLADSIHDGDHAPKKSSK